MANAIRNLNLTVGLVTAEVGVFKATNERNSIELNRIHVKSKVLNKDGTPAVDTSGNPIFKGCMGATGTKVFCKQCGIEPGPHDEMGKGYQFEKGQYVQVDEKALDDIKVESNGSIATQEVVSRDTLLAHAEFLTGQVYYLYPPQKAKYPATAYAAILLSLGDDVIIGRTALYGREYTVAVMKQRDVLMMYTIRYKDEMRTVDTLSLPTVPPQQAQLMRMVLDSMKSTDLSLDYVDEFMAGKKAVIDAAIAGTAVTVPVAQPVRQDLSLEASLQATLDMLKAGKHQKARKDSVESAPATAKKTKKAKANAA